MNQPVLSEREQRRAINAKQIEYVDTRGETRICWPSILMYEYGGEQLPIPPVDATPYTLVEKDRPLLDALRSTGWLFAPEHTGREKVAIIDNRLTS